MNQITFLVINGCCRSTAPIKFRCCLRASAFCNEADPSSCWNNRLKYPVDYIFWSKLRYYCGNIYFDHLHRGKWDKVICLWLNNFYYRMRKHFFYILEIITRNLKKKYVYRVPLPSINSQSDTVYKGLNMTILFLWFLKY